MHGGKLPTGWLVFRMHADMRVILSACVCLCVFVCVCACPPLMVSALVNEGFCLNIPLGVLSRQHKHFLHNEELGRTVKEPIVKLKHMSRTATNRRRTHTHTHTHTHCERRGCTNTHFNYLRHKGTDLFSGTGVFLQTFFCF